MNLQKNENIVNLIVNSGDYNFLPGNTNESFQITITSDIISSIKRWAIGSVTIPYSWYGIDATNNVFKFSRGGAFIVIVPVGNYSALQLASVLQTSMNLADANAYVVTYSAITGKFTISGTANFTLDFTDVANMKKVLGFPNNTYTGTNTYTGGNAAILSTPNNILITSNKMLEITNGLGWVNLGPNLGYYRSNVIDNFLVNGIPNSVMQFYNATNNVKWHYASHSKLFNIDFQLRDGSNYNKIMNLNGVPWSIELIFEIDKNII